MERALATVGLALALGACSTVPNGQISSVNVNALETTYVLPVNTEDGTVDTVGAFGDGATYMIAVPVDDGWCYTRVDQGLPADQICQFGDLIRYSPDAPLATSLRPIPSYILALFDTLAEADSIRTASLAQSDTGEPTLTELPAPVTEPITHEDEADGRAVLPPSPTPSPVAVSLELDPQIF